ncbi:malonyl-ACP O-methyltransferase BioC [Paenibacillus prosopidis]|uniref:Malonyl-[acyl-carrier protein] O-methyltransferase n=1 Tax=Paenibacillus prosopidis TaxID=630520 RepID=A0A368VNJ5_9BACL|nr:malonyl-ACP O-methyltransferase BioC [Paenibacillus prosopidis]RCW43098.1 malonyl-CoA O-methyltransferase [Paenibacillus prosopidis]
MDTRINSIRRQFNRSAEGSYDSHALVQRSMAGRLAKSLHGWMDESEADGGTILEIGCGTGILTELLLNGWPCSSITALDIAPEMIEAAEQRVSSFGQSARVRFLPADVETWAAEAPPASFNLIVSNACFQWLRNPKETLGFLRRLLRPGGMLAFTTFGPDTFSELHESFAEAYRAGGMEPQRHGLSFQPSAQWQIMLREAGFRSIHFDRSIEQERHASVRDFLLSVKAVGASTSEAASRGLGSRRLFAEMFKKYEDKFSIPGGVAASYEVILIQAISD